MSRARLLAVAAAVAALVTLAAPAAADPPADAPADTTYLHLPAGGHLTTPGGADLALPPGYYVDEGSWGRLDAEVRRLQEVETRLTAEDASLRSASSRPPGGWAYLAALTAGALAGAAATYYALHR